MILFVNGCVRKNSRTLELAKAVLAELPGEVQEVGLYTDGPEGLDEEKLNLREALLAGGEYGHPMFRWAKQFAQADTVVVAVPYWDLLFPTKLRAYLEEVTVSGITFCYGEDGVPRGLCKAKRLIYVTTAGGPIIWHLGFEYVEKLARAFYGISDVIRIQAEGLDIFGADAAGILDAVKKEILAELTGKNDGEEGL